MRRRKVEAMNWISNVVRPKIRNYFARRETPENLWIKCPETGQLVFYKDVEANQFVIPSSNYHMRMGDGDAGNLPGHPAIIARGPRHHARASGRAALRRRSGGKRA